MNIRYIFPEKFPPGGEVEVVCLDETDFGPIQVGWHEGAMCLLMIGKGGETILRLRLEKWKAHAITPSKKTIQQTHDALKAFKKGDKAAYPPLLLVGTPFQQNVWRALLDIPFGATTTYLAVARKLGTAGVRSVGTAVGRNPVSLLVPCHRVIGTDGGLCGYAWGLPLKERLLIVEKMTQALK